MYKNHLLTLLHKIDEIIDASKSLTLNSHSKVSPQTALLETILNIENKKDTLVAIMEREATEESQSLQILSIVSSINNEAENASLLIDNIPSEGSKHLRNLKRHLSSLILLTAQFLAPEHAMENDKRSSLNTQQDELEERLDRTIDRYSKKEAELLNRLNRNETKIKEYEKTAKDSISTIDNLIKSAEAHLGENLKGFQIEIGEKTKDLGEHIALVTGQSIATDYSLKSTAEGKTASLLRLCSIFLMLLTFYLAYNLFNDTTPTQITIPFVVNKVALLLLLSIPAAYLAKESARHRNKQFDYTQAQLDLSGVDPYIASLPRDKQIELKMELAKSIFARDKFKEQSKENKYRHVSNSEMHDILLELIKKLELPKK